jgi:energy-converting hydrogenase Eha subunit H
MQFERERKKVNLLNFVHVQALHAMMATLPLGLTSAQLAQRALERPATLGLRQRTHAIQTAPVQDLHAMMATLPLGSSRCLALANKTK